MYSLISFSFVSYKGTKICSSACDSRSTFKIFTLLLLINSGSLFMVSFSWQFIRYELRAVRLNKLNQMKLETQNLSDTSAYEVEMSETKLATT